MKNRSVICVATALSWICAGDLTAENLNATTAIVPRVHFRRPVSLAAVDGFLLVANRRSGTLSLIDTSDRRVVSETRVGQCLSDLTLRPGSRFLLTDERANQVVVGCLKDGQVLIRQRVDVATAPVTVRFSADTGTCSVASLWARRLTLLRENSELGGRLEVRQTIDLPFAPRMQVFLPDGATLVVADGFGGQLAIVDAVAGKLMSIRSIDGHNIRGLSVSHDGQELLLAHQMLTSLMPTTRQRVFWGQVISNLLRSVRIPHLLDDIRHADAAKHTAVKIAHWSLHPLGRSGDATGDPGRILITPSRARIVCFSGVNQIGISASAANLFRRIDVGQRPTALALDQHGRLYVANTHDDSISVVDAARGEVMDTISLGRTPIPSLVDRGEMLFYDARLTLDGWFSCHSCHTDGHSNGRLNDNFGDDAEGTPKRVLSLLGVELTHPWAWKGTRHWLSNQVRKSIETTMRGKEEDFTDAEKIAALTEFLRTLPPPPSLLAARGNQDTAAVDRGEQVFRRLECTRCHTPPTYTSYDVYDVGLEDEAGETEFNPPSLLGVSQRDGLFHDSRAKRLRDLFEEFGHPHGQTRDLSTSDLQELVLFLQSL